MITVGVAVSTPMRGLAEDLERSIGLVEFVDSRPLWHSAWVGDSILGLPVYDSTVVLAALAARTSRVRLGVSCMATLGLRQPIVVAHEWATLDVLSAGRMTLMTSAGNRTGPGHERELAAFGLEFDEKVARFEEYLGFLRAASAGGVIDFAGEFVNLRGVELRPQFIQQPLPIWVVANPGSTADAERVARTVGRAARLGDGWLTYNVTPELLARRVAALDDALPEARRPRPGEAGDRFPVGVQVNFHLADGRADAEASVRKYWSTRRPPRGLDPEALDAVCAIGTADDVAGFVARLTEAGANHVTLFPLSDDPGEQVERATDELLPAIVDLTPGAELRVAPWIRAEAAA